MNRIEKWAEIQVIGTYIGLGILALIVLTSIVFLMWLIIDDWRSKRATKKYEKEKEKGGNE